VPSRRRSCFPLPTAATTTPQVLRNGGLQGNTGAAALHVGHRGQEPEAVEDEADLRGQHPAPARAGEEAHDQPGPSFSVVGVWIDGSADKRAK